ncbi:hypothetical protein QQS21_000471 [Conoideocrella luteorostrata]|uniref:Uncharacterized protein n=1 Tax=Conoideocrella luteorostrata TaxID=1105319 RepID=A0AAJ0CYY2_9HYPO|nr:hypothetical protein QQS21_000471 [Conoideocrella luteorostrata]
MALVLPSLANPTQLEKRDVMQLWVYQDGGCGGNAANGAATYYQAGICSNFPTNVYGAKWRTPGSKSCKLKFWADNDCHGRATVWTAEGFENNGQCHGISNGNGVQLYLTNGARSIQIVC